MAVHTEGDIIAHRREDGQRRSLVGLNLEHVPQSFALGGHVALSTQFDRDGEAVGGTLTLRPDEGLVVELA